MSDLTGDRKSERRFKRGGGATSAREASLREAGIADLFERHLFQSSLRPEELKGMLGDLANKIPAYLDTAGSKHDVYQTVLDRVQADPKNFLARGITHGDNQITNPLQLDAALQNILKTPDAPRELSGKIGQITNWFKQRPEFSAIGQQNVGGVVKLVKDSTTGNWKPAAPLTFTELFSPSQLRAAVDNGTLKLEVPDEQAYLQSLDNAFSQFEKIAKYDQLAVRWVKALRASGSFIGLSLLGLTGTKVFGWGSGIYHGVQDATQQGMPQDSAGGTTGVAPTLGQSEGSGQPTSQNLINQGIDASPRYQQPQYGTTPLQDLNNVQSQTGGAGFGPFQRQDWQLRNQNADYAQHGVYNAYDALLQDDMQDMRNDYLPPTAGTMAAYPSLYRGASTIESEKFFRQKAAERRADEEITVREAQIAGAEPTAPATPAAPSQAEISPEQVQQMLAGIPDEETLLTQMNQLAQKVSAAYGTLDSMAAQTALAQGFHQLPGVQEAMRLWAQMAPHMGLS